MDKFQFAMFIIWLFIILGAYAVAAYYGVITI